jgi:hypothetical protein
MRAGTNCRAVLVSVEENRPMQPIPHMTPIAEPPVEGATRTLHREVDLLERARNPGFLPIRTAINNAAPIGRCASTCSRASTCRATRSESGAPCPIV